MASRSTQTPVVWSASRSLAAGSRSATAGDLFVELDAVPTVVRGEVRGGDARPLPGAPKGSA